MASYLLKAVRRHSIVITLPSLVAGSIWLDYSHTAEWKRKRAQEQNEIPSKTPRQ